LIQSAGELIIRREYSDWEAPQSSQAKTGHGSPLCAKFHQRIVKQIWYCNATLQSI